MRNVISIDSRYDCVCNAVVATDTKTDEIVLEVITGDSTNPCVKLIVNDESHYIKLKANQSNYVNITSESWTLGESIQFQYVNNEYEGTLFTLNFPAIVKDITVSQTGETEFTVKSLINSTRALMLEDIVNDLTSTDIYKVLGADQGKVLDGKISDVNNKILNANTNIDTLTKSLGTLISGENVSNKDFDSLPWRSFVGYGSNMTNDPVKNSQCAYLIQQIYSNQQLLQIAIALNWQNGDLIYYRRFRNGWGNWYRFANTEQITTINNSIALLNSRFNILKENSNFTLAITGVNIIRLVGQITTTEATTIWKWVIAFNDIADKYKPVASRMIKDVSQSYKFELNKAGYIQTAESLPAGTYYFDVAWLARG